MTFRNRQGQSAEERFSELEKTLSLENLVGTEIKTSFPDAGSEQTFIELVDDSGTLYIVVLAKGKRYRAQLTEF